MATGLDVKKFWLRKTSSFPFPSMSLMAASAALGRTPAGAAGPLIQEKVDGGNSGLFSKAGTG
jgi:hypothetical protein